MTPPSSPRAGRSTVSTAGEPRTDLSRFSTPSAKALMEWADSARRGPDVLTLRRTLVATLPRIEAEAAESRPSVTERPVWLIAVIEEHTFDSSRGGRCSCGEWPAGGERYHTEHLASKIAAASPAGPEAVPQSETPAIVQHHEHWRFFASHPLPWELSDTSAGFAIEDANHEVLWRFDHYDRGDVERFVSSLNDVVSVEEGPYIRGYNRGWDDAKDDSGAVPQSEREGLDVEMTEMGGDIPTEATIGANQARAALSSPAHPDEPPKEKS
jgi:hypothetical protein